MVKALVSQSTRVQRLLSPSKVDSAFHPSEGDKMSTSNFWELSGKE